MKIVGSYHLVRKLSVLKLKSEINSEMKERRRRGRSTRVYTTEAQRLDLLGLQPSITLAWAIDFKMKFQQNAHNTRTKKQANV